MARLALEGRGIRSELFDEFIAISNPHIARAVVPIRLMVRRSDARRAARVLGGRKNRTPKSRRCPGCKSSEVSRSMTTRYFSIALMAFAPILLCGAVAIPEGAMMLRIATPISMVLSFALFLRSRWTCHACGHRFETR